MKIGVIIQARSNSSRFPLKVLKELPYGNGITVLEQIIRRVKKAKYINEIIIATTRSKEDDQLVSIARKEKVNYFRGSEYNVLERYYLAAKKFQLDHIVQICGDNPCTDYKIIGDLINKHICGKQDLTTNSLSKTYPLGLNVEIASFIALEKTFFGATKDYEKEHIFQYIIKTKAKNFKILSVSSPINYSQFHLRLTLDTQDDYIFLCSIYDYLYDKNKFFPLENIIELIKAKPWLTLINAHILQRKVFVTETEELEEAVKLADSHGMSKVKKILTNLANKNSHYR